MYIIDLFYIGNPFLFENYGLYVGKGVYLMYLDKERESKDHASWIWPYCIC